MHRTRLATAPGECCQGEPGNAGAVAALSFQNPVRQAVRTPASTPQVRVNSQPVSRKEAWIYGLWTLVLIGLLLRQVWPWLEAGGLRELAARLLNLPG
jgi:hypothetical protein